jgi:hypothetical protein
MRRGGLAAVCLTAATLTGCATAKTLETRDEWLSATQHVYNRSPEEVIRAADAVLRQADPTDFKFAHRPDGFVAQRPWFIYAVIAAASGIDYWNFSVAPQAPGQTAALVQVTQDSNVIAASPYVGRHNVKVGTTSVSAPGVPLSDPASYALFWARVDYVLGLRPDWVACDQVKAKLVLPPGALTQAGALCNITTHQHDPPPPVMGAPPPRAGAVSVGPVHSAPMKQNQS